MKKLSGLFFLMFLTSCATPRRKYSPDFKMVNGYRETTWEYTLNNYRRMGQLEKERANPTSYKPKSCKYTCLGL